MRAKGLPVCAMLLAFVAAIEQNVLKLGALPNASRARIVKTALYLQRFLSEVSIS
jgi:ABC-type polysaccharide transport system permease subunit